MGDREDIIRKTKEIYKLLPRLNCGMCGLDHCSQFARAVAEGKASPFGCRQNPWVGYKISEIMGVKIPAFGYGFYQPSFAGVSSSPVSLTALRKEVKGLSHEAEDILVRIKKLRSKTLPI